MLKHWFDVPLNKTFLLYLSHAVILREKNSDKYLTFHLNDHSIQNDAKICWELKQVLFWNQNLNMKKTVKLFLHLWFESMSNKNIYHASLIYCTFFFFDNFHFEKLWQQKKRTILKVNIENLPLYVCHRFHISRHDMKPITLFHKINISKIFALSRLKFDSCFLLSLVLLCKKILKV